MICIVRRTKQVFSSWSVVINPRCARSTLALSCSTITFESCAIEAASCPMKQLPCTSGKGFPFTQALVANVSSFIQTAACRTRSNTHHHLYHHHHHYRWTTYELPKAKTWPLQKMCFSGKPNVSNPMAHTHVFEIRCTVLQPVYTPLNYSGCMIVDSLTHIDDLARNVFVKYGYFDNSNMAINVHIPNGKQCFFHQYYLNTLRINHF